MRRKGNLAISPQTLSGIGFATAQDIAASKKRAPDYLTVQNSAATLMVMRVHMTELMADAQMTWTDFPDFAAILLALQIEREPSDTDVAPRLAAALGVDPATLRWIARRELSIADFNHDALVELARTIGIGRDDFVALVRRDLVPGGQDDPESGVNASFGDLLEAWDFAASFEQFDAEEDLG